MHYIQTKIIRPLNIHEFFLFDIDEPPEEEEVKELLDQIKDDPELVFQSYEELEDYVWENATGQGVRRYGIQIDLKVVLKKLVLLYPDESVRFFARKIEDLYGNYNARAKHMVNGFMHEAYNSLRGEIHYHKLEIKDPKVRNPEQRMITSYFRKLDNPQKTICVHNGWSMGGDASKQDFCSKEGWFYLRRYIIAWGDSIKLRYGNGPEDSPYLWERMTEYVAGLGKIFDGVRIDNAHSTPKHVAQYLLQKLRSANPNSYVLAEFFTNSRESEAEATRELGINGLIREMQNYGNCKDLSTQCHSYGGCQEYIIGKLDDQYLDHSTGQMYRKLKQRYPLPVFYDMTHDNISTIEKFYPGTISLPHMALGSFLCCSISSTYGFDILLPQNLSVVKEHRPYKLVDIPDEEEVKEEKKEKVPENFTIYYVDAKAKKVDIAGTLTKWKPLRMTKKKDGWQYTIKRAGKHEFKFLVDDEWKTSNKYPIEGVSGNN